MNRRKKNVRGAAQQYPEPILYYFRNLVPIGNIEEFALWKSDLPEGGMLILVDEDEYVTTIWNEDDFVPVMGPDEIDDGEFFEHPEDLI